MELGTTHIGKGLPRPRVAAPSKERGVGGAAGERCPATRYVAADWVRVKAPSRRAVRGLARRAGQRPLRAQRLRTEGGIKRENGGRPRNRREGGQPPSSRPPSPLAHPTPPLGRTELSSCGDGTTHVDIAHIHGLGDATRRWPDFGPMALD